MMQKSIEITPVSAKKKVEVKTAGKYIVKATVGSTVKTPPKVQKGGIRKNGPVTLSPIQESMRVSVVDSFNGILEMNEKALKIVAKRA